MRTVGKTVFLLLVGFAFMVPWALEANEAAYEDQLLIRTQDGEEFMFNVELALTAGQQMKGLMNRKHLDENAGMLFVFDDEEKRVFWMKNTLIPLDMLFLSRDGTIHHIHHRAKPQDLSQITSERPSLAVLEINGGQSDMLGIKTGDKVIHPAFRNTALGQ